MPFPKNLDELRKAGYKFVFARACAGCGKHIEFWKTPAGRMLPMEIESFNGIVTPHWATCPKAKDFKR